MEDEKMKTIACMAWHNTWEMMSAYFAIFIINEKLLVGPILFLGKDSPADSPCKH